jgi:hypothetical protein
VKKKFWEELVAYLASLAFRNWGDTLTQKQQDDFTRLLFIFFQNKENGQKTIKIY